MSQPQLNISQLTTTFTAFTDNVTTFQEAFAIKAGYGAMPPAYPIEVIVDTDYTNVTATRNTWFSNIATNNILIEAEYVGLLTAQSQVILDCPPGTWVQLTADVSGDFSPYPDTVWIGYRPVADGVSNTLERIVVLSADPILAFPGDVNGGDD